jgi:hypothetical protein
VTCKYESWQYRLFDVKGAVKDGSFTIDMQQMNNIPVIRFLSNEVVNPTEIIED